MSNLALDSPCLEWPHRYCSSCLSCREAGEQIISQFESHRRNVGLKLQDQDDVMRRLLFGILINA